MYEAAVEGLTALLYGSGAANDALEAWTHLLLDEASDLIEPSVIQRESEGIAQLFPK